MDNNIKIAIADNDKMIQSLLLKSIKSYNDIDITCISNDGQSCINGLQTTKPDILIMDMLLAKVAGFELLDYIKNNSVNRNLVIIVMTAVTNTTFIQRINEYNVDYIYYKPFNYDDLIKAARISYRTKLTKKDKHIKNKIIHNQVYGIITDLLISLGIKTNLLGFSYLKTAIFKVYKEEGLLGSMTKELYPLIGEIYETKAVNVERAMRNAINKAWKDETMLNSSIKLYSQSFKIDQRPSNSKFIAVTCHYLKSKNLNKNI